MREPRPSAMNRRGWLTVRWDKRQNDLVYGWPTNAADGALMNLYFNRSGFDPAITRELEARGYDITTLQFRIKKKDMTPWP